jgi:hypothetical protein
MQLEVYLAGNDRGARKGHGTDFTTLPGVNCRYAQQSDRWLGLDWPTPNSCSPEEFEVQPDDVMPTLRSPVIVEHFRQQPS